MKVLAAPAAARHMGPATNERSKNNKSVNQKKDSNKKAKIGVKTAVIQKPLFAKSGRNLNQKGSFS